MGKIKKIAIANRGEIAHRIISTCHQMGLETVLLYASGDTENEAFRLAREAVCIGPANSLESYLNCESNIQGALGAGAQALHPGYGFLSEDGKFAKQCEEKGLIFIGPSPETIDLFGNKIEARKLCEKLSVPVLPSWTGDTKKEDQLVQEAQKIGYPLMIKAACGGGGRGLRVAFNEEGLKKLLPIVRSEAKKSFNNDQIFLEKYLDAAKHIEVQVFGSADGTIYILGDRDCSLQRRHQKIIEQAPSSLSESAKQKMKEICIEICQSLKYQGAGTIEFLFQENQFYFLEMNTRIQVEHTVTEMIFGVDLIRAQILTALNQPAFSKDQKFKPQGHSLQCRICAENPKEQFLPSTGRILSSRWPSGLGKRVDKGFNTGDCIRIEYDSLIAKVITWDETRVRNIEKMKKALEETIIFGIQVNIPFLQYALSHPLFISDEVCIDSLEKTLLPQWNPDKPPLSEDFARKIFEKLKSSARDKEISFNPWTDFR